MWIKVHDTAPSHPKVRRLARLSGVSVQTALGHLVSLWIWVGTSHPDGDLGSVDALDVELAANWDGDDGVLYAALVASKLLDETDEGLRVHDWQDHMGSYTSRTRQQRYRERKREEREALRNDDITVMQRDVTTTSPLRPRTEQNREEEEQNREEQHSTACARDEFSGPAHQVTRADELGEVIADDKYGPQRVEAVLAGKGWRIGPRQFAQLSGSEVEGRELAYAIAAAEAPGISKPGPFAISVLVGERERAVNAKPMEKQEEFWWMTPEEREEAKRDVERTKQAAIAANGGPF
jgi:hypothetical protein